MDLTVIICSWNRAKSLRIVLESLEKCVVPSSIAWEILVIDNNSTDDTRAVCAEFIQKSPARFRYLFEPKQGKTHALNAGIALAQGEIIALTDDDLTVDPNWVKGIYEIFKEFDCAAVGGRIVPVWDFPKPRWITFDGPFRHPAYGGIVNFDKGDLPCEVTSTLTGANMAVRKEVFAKHGPYRPDLNRITDLLGGEDTEYCRRLLKAGERLMYAPNAIVYHPVERHRATWRYMQSMAFHYGRWMTRVDGLPEGSKCYFGVPRFFLPIAARCFLTWWTSLSIHRRAFYRLEFCQTLGQMVEGRRWLRDHRTQHPLQTKLAEPR